MSGCNQVTGNSNWKAGLYHNKKWLYQKYWGEKLSLQEIAEICDVSNTTIHRLMINFDIPRRSPSEAQRGMFCGPKNPMYGKKHTPETLKKMSESRKGLLCGRDHPCYGKRGEKSRSWKGGRKVSTSGYVVIFKPGHPYANSNGYIPEHRLVMERHIGRYLDFKELVHHIDSNRKNNVLSNLKILTRKEHTLLHHKIGSYNQNYQRSGTSRVKEGTHLQEFPRTDEGEIR